MTSEISNTKAFKNKKCSKQRINEISDETINNEGNLKRKHKEVSDQNDLEQIKINEENKQDKSINYETKIELKKPEKNKLKKTNIKLESK